MDFSMIYYIFDTIFYLYILYSDSLMYIFYSIICKRWFYLKHAFNKFRKYYLISEEIYNMYNLYHFLHIAKKNFLHLNFNYLTREILSRLSIIAASNSNKS